MLIRKQRKGSIFLPPGILLAPLMAGFFSKLFTIFSMLVSSSTTVSTVTGPGAGAGAGAGAGGGAGTTGSMQRPEIFP